MSRAASDRGRTIPLIGGSLVQGGGVRVKPQQPPTGRALLHAAGKNSIRTHSPEEQAWERQRQISNESDDGRTQWQQIRNTIADQVKGQQRQGQRRALLEAPGEAESLGLSARGLGGTRMSVGRGGHLRLARGAALGQHQHLATGAESPGGNLMIKSAASPRGKGSQGPGHSGFGGASHVEDGGSRHRSKRNSLENLLAESTLSMSNASGDEKRATGSLPPWAMGLLSEKDKAEARATAAAHRESSKGQATTIPQIADDSILHHIEDSRSKNQNGRAILDKALLDNLIGDTDNDFVRRVHEVVEEIRKLYDLVDEDGNGDLTQPEMQAFANKIRRDFGLHEVHMPDLMIPDEDSHLDLERFVEVLLPIAQKVHNDPLAFGRLEQLDRMRDRIGRASQVRHSSHGSGGGRRISLMPTRRSSSTNIAGVQPNAGRRQSMTLSAALQPNATRGDTANGPNAWSAQVSYGSEGPSSLHGSRRPSKHTAAAQSNEASRRTSVAWLMNQNGRDMSGGQGDDITRAGSKVSNGGSPSQRINGKAYDNAQVKKGLALMKTATQKITQASRFMKMLGGNGQEQKPNPNLTLSNLLPGSPK
eukprot:TRINITY_DN66093_c0_g1_i3.p1 TRINITY_DN66093_c0_g1~~TRINITY_DN66093_c0_g1_i3.p1  ORF type:complete len:591 (+),score=83.36 TRINITY_DN66093_c0_g1_i3:158-1930(+)